MNVIALILAIVAVVLFSVEFGRTKSLVTLGLAFLGAAWIVQSVWQVALPILIH